MWLVPTKMKTLWVTLHCCVSLGEKKTKKTKKTQRKPRDPSAMEWGGSACSLFLRKYKITTYILFWPILLKTILIQLFSHVELNTTQYDRKRDLVILLRSMWVTSNDTRKLDSLWESWYEKKKNENLSRLRSYICMSAVKTPWNPRGSQGKISRIPWHPMHYRVSSCMASVSGSQGVPLDQ